jgi:hypothetical protein
MFLRWIIFDENSSDVGSIPSFSLPFPASVEAVERAIKNALFDFGPAPLCVLTNLGNGIFLRVPPYFQKLTGFAGHFDTMT